MNKEEWIWVSIKIFGIYLLVLAIIALPNIIAGIYSVITLETFTGNSTEIATSETSKLLNKFSQAQLIQSIKSFAQLIIYTLSGLYLIKGGNFIHRLICKSI